MSAISPSIKTLADLLVSLGDIHPIRIRIHPSPGTANLKDVIEARHGENVLWELVTGVLVAKAVGFAESGLAAFLITNLNPFVRSRNLGLLTGAGGAMELQPGLVRIPDVAFTCWNRLPGRRCPVDPIPALAPNLAVEVLRRGNTRGEMCVKRQHYFDAGVELVWEIDPHTRQVMVYTSVSDAIALTVADVLDGRTVLPGFALSVRDLFAELDRHG